MNVWNWRVLRSLVLAIGMVGVVGLTSCQVSFNSSGGGFDRSGENATRSETGRIADAVREIDVVNQYGQVRVEVAEGEPSWDWELTCWAKTALEADEFLEQIDLLVSDRDGRCEWKVSIPESRRGLRGVESNLVLRVPTSVKTRIRNSFGATSIKGTHGGVEVKNSHGGVSLDTLQGEIVAETSFGSIDARDISGGKLRNSHGKIEVATVRGDLEAKTSFSSLQVQDVTGNLDANNSHGRITALGVGGHANLDSSFAKIEAEDIGGDLHIENQHGPVLARKIGGGIEAKSSFAEIHLDVESPRVICRNSHGPIRLDLHCADLESVRAQTTFGRLHVRLPTSLLESQIAADTSYGDVRSELPLGGSGGPRVDLTNKHGDIVIQSFAARNTRSTD